MGLSKILFLNTSPLVQQRLQVFWGFQVGALPCSYLEVPFFVGQVKSGFWDKVVSTISKRIMSWNHKWLTLAGKILLIKSILNVVPIYLMSVLKTLRATIVDLQSTLRDLL